MIQKKKKKVKKKNHDITQGNNKNKRGVVRTMRSEKWRNKAEGGRGKGEGEMRSEEKWWGSKSFVGNQIEFFEWGVRHGSHKK